MEEGLKLVFAAARREQEKQRLPLVITGDFNFTPAARHRLIWKTVTRISRRIRAARSTILARWSGRRRSIIS